MLPPRLLPGQAIGYCSPSSPATASFPTRTARARKYLKAKGFRLVPGSLSGQRDGYRSGSIAARVEELNALIANPDVRCILSTIGGSNSNALLTELDYDALRADPKIIMGYSDMTAVLLGMYARTGLVTFYGPALVASFGEFPPLVDETYANCMSVLMDGHLVPHTVPKPERWTDQWLNWETQNSPKVTVPNTCRFQGSGRVEGRLIGGNLNTMTAIWGSPYMPTIEDGDVLLIEDGLKSIATVERLFSFLYLNGVFSRVSAVLLGKHEGFDDGGTGRQPIDVLREVLRGQEIPVVVDVDCCHTHPMWTLPIGLPVRVDFDAETLTRLSPCVR